MPPKILAAVVLALLLLPAAARADVVHRGGGDAAGTTTAQFPVTVPSGGGRLLAVGIATQASVTVTSVTFGGQALARQGGVSEATVLSEVWTLTAPSVTTADVTVTVSGSAPVIAGASVFTGVDGAQPITLATGSADLSANSASLVVNGTTTADAMFGTIAVGNAINIGSLSTSASVDTVTADLRWQSSIGGIRGGGATRGGNTGQNMALSAGISWRWSFVDPQQRNPYAQTLVALRAATTSPPSADAGGPYTVAEGGSLSLDSSASSDADGDTLTSSWDVDDDGTFGDATGVSPTLSWAQLQALGVGDGPASRTVRVRVSDGTDTVTASASLLVTNSPPTGALAGQTATEGSTATIGLTSVTDPSSDDVAAGLRYAYDLDDDGTYEIGSASYASASTSPTAQLEVGDGPATRTVRAAVVDRDGGLSAYTATVTVTNAPPTGTLAGQTVAEGSTATVALTNATDPSSDDVVAGLRYAFDFDDDGTYEVGSTTYASAWPSPELPLTVGDGPATRAVRVAVVDRDGGFSVHTATITIVNVAPTGTLDDSGPVDEGATAQVSWSDVRDASVADAAAGLRYAYDLDDDGTYEIGGATYAAATADATVDVPAELTADGDATHVVRAAVIDRDGGRREYTTTLTVRNVAPTATLTGGSVTEGSTATVAFTDQDDPSADDVAAGFHYEYDLDDDGTFETATDDPTATLPAALTEDGPATFRIAAAIIDRDGGRREYTTTITVANAPPVATLDGPESVSLGSAVTLAVDATDASPNDLLTARLDWGDGTSETVAPPAEVGHTYARPGVYTVTLVVRDDDGEAGATVSHAVTVVATVLPARLDPTPAATPVPTPAAVAGAAAEPAITGVRVTPRCVRATDLRARAARTVTLRFRLSEAGPVRFRLQRWTGKRGASKCPPLRGTPQRGGRRVPGVYSPHSDRAANARAGVNTVRIAATGRNGRLLRPGTYLLTVESGGVIVRTKLWVLAP